MTGEERAYRARETAVAFGLSAVGLVCAGWLLVKAVAEIFPRGAR